MAKSMLNPPEREQYGVGGEILKRLAKPLANLFEDSSEKAIENKMKAVHKAVEEAPAGTKRADTFKKVAEKEDITVQDVKDIEKVFAYRAGGGGGNESILGETVQTLRAMTKKPTAGQQVSEELGGTATTRAARRGKGFAVLGTAALTVPTTALSTAWFMRNDKEPTAKQATDFEKAFSKAFNAGEETFMFKGKEYTTEVRKGKAEGSEMESFETTRTREAAIEKDERERKERMIKAEAKRLGISEEKLKEIMLEREQAEMDRKMQEAAERQSRAPLLVGGQTELDANKDGDISAEDFAMLRDRKAEGSLTKEELEDGTYDVQRMEGDDFKSIIMSRPLREDEGGFTDKELQEYRERMALFDKLAEPYVKAGKPIPKKINDLSLGKVPPSLVRGMERSGKAEGSMLVPVEGMPVDTYPNIPEDEMDEALASQLPDAEMEEDYIEFIMDESLSDSEQDYLAGVLQQDNRLSDILDKVITTASEFSGAGEVEGPGTGVSDSIPARLSDGEFVFTKKATDQIGADALQRMMDDAERAYDGGYQMKAVGGMMEDEDPEALGMSQTQEEIEKLMMGANRMPSLQ
jgi:cation transport regulator ChaC